MIDLEGINYLPAKFQINILENKKVIKLLELQQKKKNWNREYKSVLWH